MENLSSKRKEKMESISSYHSSLFQFLNKIKCFSEYSNFAIKRTLLCWKYIISHWKIEVYNITPIFIGYIWGFKEGRDWTLVFQMERTIKAIAHWDVFQISLHLKWGVTYEFYTLGKRKGQLLFRCNEWWE